MASNNDDDDGSPLAGSEALAPPPVRGQGPVELTARSFTAWPAWADLSLDVVHYGPDIPTEADLRLLGSLEGKRVLELGCGGGPISVAMAKQGAKVIAIDGSAEQIAHARRLAEREEVKLELRQGDFADLAAVRADTIDVAISVYSLGAVDDLDRVFRQVHRVLRPEAPIVLSLQHPAYRAIDPSGDPPTLRRSYFDHTPMSWAADAERGADHPMTIGELFTALSRANFRVDTILEPEPDRTGARGRHWTPAMRWVPATLIVRARKLGV
ncbi:MAG: class I SAM-dependent methyltransferase [Acidimicrobiales bacterium]